MFKYVLSALAAFALASSPQNARADDAKLAVIVFPGVQNLPMFAAQAKGLYAKRGLNVEIKFTPNSDELRNGLAEGRYQIAHSAVDNAFALKDKANVDIAVVSGGDNSFNHPIVQPEITSLADIKGKTVAVDAVNTAYAFSFMRSCVRKDSTKATTRSAGRRNRIASRSHDKGQNIGCRHVESAVFHSRRKGWPQGYGQRSSCTRRIPGNERVRAASMGQGECRYIGQIS